MILILGKNGQVGRALAALLGTRCVAVGSDVVDLSKLDFTSALDALAAQHPITAVINAAAYTAVDKAEAERELAMRINGTAVGELAVWCARKHILLVHYSTDYVFDGSGTQARTEDAPTAPLSVYGESKLLGEQLIAASGAKHLIFRTSWVYDETGKNFVNTMRRLFKERETLSVVADQIGAPTYAKHLAEATLSIIFPLPLREGLGEGWTPQNTALDSLVSPPTPALPLKGGGSSNIYHLCGGGETSWHGFAQAIFALACAHESGIKCQLIQPISTCEYPTPAKRPLNSRLDCTRAAQTFSVRLPHWEDALKECYANIKLRD